MPITKKEQTLVFEISGINSKLLNRKGDPTDNCVKILYVALSCRHPYSFFLLVKFNLLFYKKE